MAQPGNLSLKTAKLRFRILDSSLWGIGMGLSFGFGHGKFSKLGSLSRSFFVRVPYNFGDLTKDPNLENYLM